MFCRSSMPSMWPHQSKGRKEEDAGTPSTAGWIPQGGGRPRLWWSLVPFWQQKGTPSGERVLQAYKHEKSPQSQCNFEGLNSKFCLKLRRLGLMLADPLPALQILLGVLGVGQAVNFARGGIHQLGDAPGP